MFALIQESELGSFLSSLCGKRQKNPLFQFQDPFHLTSVFTSSITQVEKSSTRYFVIDPTQLTSHGRLSVNGNNMFTYRTF